eukprot:1157594-Pelagomonas_calceolata.AAC.9
MTSESESLVGWTGQNVLLWRAALTLTSPNFAGNHKGPHKGIKVLAATSTLPVTLEEEHPQEGY